MVIALIVTPDGLPLAYEAMPGNTSDKTTLRDFLQRIEIQYGKAGRIWVMDRGIPTEAVLAEIGAAETPTHYLVGTPCGRLSIEKLRALRLNTMADALTAQLRQPEIELGTAGLAGGRPAQR